MLVLTSATYANTAESITSLALSQVWCMHAVGGSKNQNNIHDDAIWSQLMKAIKLKQYDAFLLLLDFTTFSPGRNGVNICGTMGRERYVIQNLTLAQKDLARAYSLMAVRSAEMAQEAVSLNIPIYIETNELKVPEPSQTRWRLAGFVEVSTLSLIVPPVRAHLSALRRNQNELPDKMHPNLLTSHNTNSIDVSTRYINLKNTQPLFVELSCWLVIHNQYPASSICLCTSNTKEENYCFEQM